MGNEDRVNLSVILPTYNRQEVLCNTLKQLLNQNPKPLEIIVVDQTKEDNAQAAALLRELIGNKQIKYISQDIPNASVARNKGVREAKGGILLFLDDDVLIPPDLVVKHFQNYKDPTIAAICGQILENKEEPTDKFPPQYYRKYTGWIHFPLNFSRRIELINLCSGNLSIRRNIIIEAGGFDENFLQAHFDDTDLGFRLRKICKARNFKVVHDPQASIIHLREPRGNRPGGINEYVIADRYAWMTWLYFFLIDFGIYGWGEILLRLRACVFRKKNILKPNYLWAAFLEFVMGAQKALGFIRQGRKLPFKSK